MANNLQLDLIDVSPENAKEIVKVARSYKKNQRGRMEFGQKEKADKNKLIELIQKANLKRQPDGTIKFRVDDITIEDIPRDDLIKVNDNSEESTE